MTSGDPRGRSVLVTRPIPDSGIAVLAEAGLAVHAHWSPRGMSADDLRKTTGRHDAVLCQLTDRIDAGVLGAAAPRCRVFANCAVGFDNVDIETARSLGIDVTNTPDVLTETTADLTWGLILATARRLPESERCLRAGTWRGWAMLDFLGMDVHGKTLGIVGAGRIGLAVARRALGFAMQVLYHDTRVKPDMEALGAVRLGLSELLGRADIVTLHVPLNDRTRHLIDADALGRMKRHAILVNTARGEVVHQAALIDALGAGRLGGAGLDVYENEPRVPKQLLQMENVVLLPHIGSASVDTRSRMARIAAENIVSVLRGNGPLNPVAP